jgi:hypothetical protein
MVFFNRINLIDLFPANFRVTIKRDIFIYTKEMIFGRHYDITLSDQLTKKLVTIGKIFDHVIN